MKMNTKILKHKADTANQPDFAKIYRDLINKKFPQKTDECKTLLDKKELTALDIIQLNQKIFGTSDSQTEIFNRKHKSYDQTSILTILNYQKKNKLNNIQLANHFKISRNSVTKWKKMFIDQYEK